MDPVDFYSRNLPGYVTYDSDFEDIQKKLYLRRVQQVNKTSLQKSNVINVKPTNHDDENIVEEVDGSTLNFNSSNQRKTLNKSNNQTASNEILKENSALVNKSINFTEKSKNASNEIKKPVKETSQSSNNINYGVNKSNVNKDLFQTNNSEDNENNKSTTNSLKSNQLAQSMSENLYAKTLAVGASINNAFAELPSDFIDLMQSDLKEFIFKPAPKGTTVRCCINRDKQGIDGGIHPAFYMYFEREDRKKTFLLAARRKGYGPSTQYVISIDPVEVIKTSPNFVGRLKPAVNANNFTLYDHGNDSKNDLDQQLRRELGYMFYDSTLKNRGPRKITVVMPSLDENGEARIIRPISEKQTIAELYKNKKTKNLLIMENKPPIWNEQSGSYALNFRGRVTESSVKNFQIIQKDDSSETKMQFGKTGPNSFTCDYSHPLSAILAFGIALSSFDF